MKRHRNAKQTGFCQQYSQREGRWKWGFRLKRKLPDGSTLDVHYHDWDTLDDAREALLAHDPKRIVVSVSARPLLTDLVAKHLAAKTGTKEETRATRVLNTWLKLLPPDLAVEDVETTHLSQYAKHKPDVKGATIDRDLNIIVACLNAARVHFKELRQWRLPSVPRPKYNRATTRTTITDDQYRKLVAWFFADRKPGEQEQAAQARHRAGRIFRFMMLTGVRTSECCALKFEDLQPQYGRIQIQGTKTDSIRYVPLVPEIQALIDDQIAYNKTTRRPEEQSSPFVFTIGGQATPKLYALWKQACDAHGIPSGRAVGFTYYSARHTKITDLLQTLDVKSVGTLVGHAHVATTMVYAHTSPNLLQIAAEQISQHEQRKLNGHTSVTPEHSQDAQNTPFSSVGQRD